MFRFRQIFYALTKREKLAFFASSATAVLSGGALVVLGLIYSTEAVPASGGEYTEGAVGQPVHVNPVLARSSTDKGLVRLVFSNINDVAEKIELSADQRIWKIRLKDGLLWQDGEFLTSDDVVFTIQKIQDPEANSPLAAPWQGVAAQRLSALELQLSLVNPYAFFRETLDKLYILPKHVFSGIPPANWRLSDYNLNPVGSGPYKVAAVEKKPNGFISFLKLSAFPDAPGEPPLIQTFRFRFFSDTEGLIQNFNSGQIDAFAGIEPDNLQKIERPYEAAQFSLPSYFAVFFNQSKNVPLKEDAVRSALNTAIQRERLIAEALGGYAQPAHGPLPTATALSAPTSTLDALGAASSTLDKAGWRISDGGVREKKIQRTAIPLEVELSVPQTNSLMSVAQYLQDRWRKIGVKTAIKLLSSGEVASETIKNRDYEAILFGNVTSQSLDLFSFWHSSERFHPGLNLSLYNSKNADSLIESIRQNFDETSRLEQLRELEKLIVGENPAIFLYSPNYLYVSNKNVKGVEPRLISEPADRFANARSWYTRTARVLK